MILGVDIVSIFTFIIAHADIIQGLYEAMELGVSKDSLKQMLLDAKVAAADAAAKAAVGMNP